MTNAEIDYWSRIWVAIGTSHLSVVLVSVALGKGYGPSLLIGVVCLVGTALLQAVRR